VPPDISRDGGPEGGPGCGPGGGKAPADPPAFRLLDALDAALARATAALGALLVVATVLLVSYSVFMRYLLNQPQTWTDELVGYFLVYIVMLGVSEALRRDDHIGVDILTGRLGPRGRRAAAIWGMVAVIAVAVAMVVSSWGMVVFAHDVGLVSDGYVEAPMWIPQLALVVGYGLLTLSATNRLLRLAFGLSEPPPASD